MRKLNLKNTRIEVRHCLSLIHTLSLLISRLVATKLQITLAKQNTSCAAAVIYILNLIYFDQQIVIRLDKNAFVMFVKTVIVFKTKIVATVVTNRPIKWLFSRYNKK